jgi:hypothetical protein
MTLILSSSTKAFACGFVPLECAPISFFVPWCNCSGIGTALWQLGNKKNAPTSLISALEIDLSHLGQEKKGYVCISAAVSRTTAAA